MGKDGRVKKLENEEIRVEYVSCTSGGYGWMVFVSASEHCHVRPGTRSRASAERREDRIRSIMPHAPLAGDNMKTAHWLILGMFEV